MPGSSPGFSSDPSPGSRKRCAAWKTTGSSPAERRGRTRLFRLAPRYFAYDELKSYLERLTDAEDDLRRRVGELRRRPRRTGKRL